jgi:hypothetical protein
MTLMRQFRLRDGVTHTVTWLPDNKRLRLGARVTLKDSAEPKRLWEVTGRSPTVKDASKIHRDWRVGGL